MEECQDLCPLADSGELAGEFDLADVCLYHGQDVLTCGCGAILSVDASQASDAATTACDTCGGRGGIVTKWFDFALCKRCKDMRPGGQGTIRPEEFHHIRKSKYNGNYTLALLHINPLTGTLLARL